MTRPIRFIRLKSHSVPRHHKARGGHRLAAAALSAVLLLQAPALSHVSAAGRALPAGNGRGTAVSLFDSAASVLGAFFGELRGGRARSAALAARPVPLTKTEREAKVARLELNTARELTLAPGGRMLFAAVPVDDRGEAVHGLTARWVSSDERVLRIDESGQAAVGQTGEARLTARVGSKQEEIRVTVAAPAPMEPGTQGLPGEQERPDAPARPAAPRRAGAQGAAFMKADWSPGGSLAPARTARHGARRLTAATPAPPVPYFAADGYTHPSNDVGKPPGKTEPGASTAPAAFAGTETPGSSNFTFDVPVAGLPGRGVSVSLSLIYNSRLWHEGNFTETGIPSTVQYNVDENWPAPGFNIGYGRVEAVRPPMGLDEIYITDPDGTRHATVRTTWSIPNDNNYDTDDGSYIHFQGGYQGGVATYTDGTRIEYGAVKNLTNPCCLNNPRAYLYPTKITDRNGNFKLISYVNGVGPKISSVQDTMGRYVRFHYDTAGDLVTITVPGYADGPDRQTLRFYYENITVNGNFTIPAFGPAGGTARVVRYVYNSGTDAGYRYDYSAYGMVFRVLELRGMSVSTTAENQAGVVTSEGQEAARTEYNYPVAPSSLARAPTYTRRTDDWAGRTAGMPGTGEAPYHTFATNQDTGLTTITAPDGTVTETRTIVEPGGAFNGLVKEVVIKSGATVLSKTEHEWERVIHNGERWTAPRIKKTSITNDAGQRRAALITYQSWYNNVASVSERDYDLADGSPGPELRRVETSYETRPEWTSRFLVRLPTSAKVFAGGSTTPALRVDSAYDQGALTPRGGLIMYTDPGAYRGNLTSVTQFADAPNGAGAETQTTSYDVAGNVTQQTASCCVLKTFTYTAAYHFAYVEAAARGVAGQLTTGTTYDFNTGLVRTATDENGQVTTTHYYADSLRHHRTESPDGGFTEDEYFDSLFPLPDATRLNSQVKTTTRLDATRTLVSYRYFDGRGAPTRSFGSTPNGFVTADTEYDALGRVRRTSNPYYSAGGATAINPPGLWTTSEYDNLGRLKRVLLQDSNAQSNENVIRMEYSGGVTTVTDQAGKQRRQVVNALGRLVRLDEPDETGSLGTVAAPAQATVYEYNVLGGLVHIAQGAQHRYFKYDSLGRVTHERHAEQDAPHFAPDPLTGNQHWSRRTEFNAQGLVTDLYDARGVRTHLEYDDLNRVREVTHTGETGDATPAVTYTYGAAPNPTNQYNIGRLTKVATAAVGSTPATAQEYEYDLMGRVTGHRQKVGADTYSMSYGYNLAGLLTSETYPSGRVVTYSYDAAGRTSDVADAGRTYLSGMSYGAHGGLEGETYGNGAQRAFSYNDRLQLSGLSLSKDGAVLQRDVYKYGRADAATGAVDATKNNGRIGVVEGWIGAAKQWEQRFSYDSADRLSLAGEHRGDNGALTYRGHYTYDRYGNRFQDGGQNQNLAYTPVTPADINPVTNRFTSGVTYDPEGHVTADAKFRGMQYRYDANGRMVWAALTNGLQETTAVYDGLGQRVQTQAGGQTRKMVYDIFGRLVAEYGGTAVGGGGVKFLVSDRQGSTRVVMNGAGVGAAAVAARHDYQPFGEEVGAGTGQRTAEQRYGATDSTRQRYAGMEHDDGTGLDHTPWRKYEARAGRWTSPDPYGGSMSTADPQSFNRYTYVNNDPVNFVDPSGLMLIDDFWFWGDKIWALPGFGSRIGDNTRYTEWQHDLMVQRSFGNFFFLYDGHRFSGFTAAQDTPCEKRLAGIFTDADKARFVDVTDGDGYDPMIQQERTFSSSYPEEHNHLYPPEGKIRDKINVFAPSGGQHLGSGVLGGQKWMSLHYKSLGGVSNVILQIWHVQNYNGKGGVPQGGRNLLGQMGDDGNIRYGGPGSPEGWHVHIQAFSWWGKVDRRGRLTDRQGRLIRGDAALGLKAVRNNHRLRLSDLFCK